MTAPKANAGAGHGAFADGSAVGVVFGPLTVIEGPWRRPSGDRRTVPIVKTRCECGDLRERNLSDLRKEPRHRCDACGRKAEALPGPGRGRRKLRAYGTWRGMRSRCYSAKDSAFKHYGGRGISICERWQNFENFLADMGERPVGRSLDRIDVNGDYEPGNCRWATDDEQATNKRTDLIAARLKAGWSLEAALSEEKQRHPHMAVTLRDDDSGSLTR